MKAISWLQPFQLFAVKSDLPPGGRSHYSKDDFQLQELSEIAGRDLQTPSDEPGREVGDDMMLNQGQQVTAWPSSKHTTSALCAAGMRSLYHTLQHPKSKANKMKDPTALRSRAWLLYYWCCTGPEDGYTNAAQCPAEITDSLL